MASYGFRGIDVGGLSDLASTLGHKASELRIQGSTVDTLLRTQREHAAAAAIAAAFGTVETWATQGQSDLVWRRDTIAIGQAAGAAVSCRLGSLDPTSVATFAATAPFTTSDRDQDYRRWYAERHPERAVAELLAVQRRIDEWSGSDNDPILDDLIRRATSWRTALAITETTMLDVALAMELGQTPAEADLPQYLFPVEYLSALDAYERSVERIAELENEYWALVEEGGAYYAAGMFDEYDATLEERAAVEAELDEIGDSLTKPSWSLAGIHQYLQDNPFLSYVDQRQAAGAYLAERIKDAESLPELTMIADLITASGRIETQSFFNHLGAAGTASIPGILAAASDSISPGGEAAEAMRAFSIALGEASRIGLEFSGADLLPPFALDEDLPHLMEVNPAVLFLYGRFDDEFIIDAALRPFEYEIEFQTMLDIGWPGHPLIVSSDDVPNGQLVDLRVILLERVAELGPATASQFITAAADRNLIEVMLYPYQGFADGGAAAGAILAQLATDTDNARTVIEAIAIGGSVDAGTAAGAELMFVPHLTALIQTQSPDGLATPISVLAGMDPVHLDRFLENIFRSGAGEEMREETNDLILYELTNTINGDTANARSAIIDYNEALGELAGRIEGARHVAGEAMARHSDEVNAARAQITGMLLEAGIGIATPGGPLIGVAGGMAADVGVGALTDRLFPQNALELFYESQYEELVGRSTTAEQATIDLLDAMGLIDKSEQPPDTTSREYERWLDETMAAGYSIDDWIGTISEIYNKADKVRTEIESGG